MLPLQQFSKNKNKILGAIDPKLPSTLLAHLRNQYVLMCILRTSTKNTLTLRNFCMHYPNVAIFGAFEPPLTCQQRKQEKLTSLIIVNRHISIGFGVPHQIFLSFGHWDSGTRTSVIPSVNSVRRQVGIHGMKWSNDQTHTSPGI